MASVRILADRLKAATSAAAAVQEVQQPVDHWSLAKEGLGLLFALGAAVQHEKGTHNLTEASSSLPAAPSRRPRLGEDDAAAPPPPWQLGLQDELAVRQVVQMVVWWGILPCLAEGVGIPLDQRLQNASTSMRLIPDRVADDARLFECTKALVDVTSRTEELRAYVLPTYLPDMMAALLQLAYGPTLSAPPVCSTPEPASSTPVELRAQPAQPAKATPASVLSAFLPQARAASSTSDQQESATTQQAPSPMQQWASPVLESSFIKAVTPQALVASLLLLMGAPSRPAPRWLSSQCGHLLSRALMRHGGVAAVLAHLGSGGDLPDALQAKIVQIITTPPKQVPKSKYYAAVCPQLRELVHVPHGHDQAEAYTRIAITAAGRMLEKQPLLTKRYFLDPILAPLALFARSSALPAAARGSTTTDLIREQPLIRSLEKKLPADTPPAESVEIDEKTLSACLDDLEKVISAHSANATLSNAVAEVMPALFQLYCYTRRSPTSLKATVTSIMDTFFLVSEGSATGQALRDLILPPSPDASTSSFALAFAPGPTGGVVIKRTKNPSRRDSYGEAECVVALLKELGNEQLMGNLFVDLLKAFVDMRRQDVDREIAAQGEPQGDDEEEEHQTERHLVLLHLLASMSEGLGEKLIQDVVQVTTLLRVMFEGGDEVVVSLCLSILSALLSGQKIKLNQAESILLLDLLPFLGELKDHPEEHISTLATELHVRIIARDRSWFSDSTTETETPSLFRKDVEQILAELRDPLLPVRAQALVALRKLVLAKDEFARANRDKILDIFQTQLRDSDSYLYYAAMRGLGALGDIFPEEIIPVLVKSFLDESLIEDTRLKLGETLVRVCERCGETLPKYGHHFVSTFLAGAQSTLSNLRASSLSNLASVCELMRFSLHPFIHDIVNVLAERLRGDPSADVRLGCLFVLSRLFAGMGVESLELLAERLKEIHQLLRHTSEIDVDAGVRGRAREVLGLMNDITRAVFQQRPPMRDDHILNVVQS